MHPLWGEVWPNRMALDDVEFSAGLGVFTTGRSTALLRRLTHLHAHPRQPLTPAAGPVVSPGLTLPHICRRTPSTGGGHLVEQQPHNALHQPSRGPAPFETKFICLPQPDYRHRVRNQVPTQPPKL